tara:strand:+ start:53 stop:505 length:453 start_codon:yes stop_codon:yes gene_type:complete
MDILKREEFIGPMTQDSAIELWNNNEDNPRYERRDGAYPLTDWFLRVIDGKVVGIQGFKDFGDYAFVGGTNSEAKGGIAAFEEYRKNYLGTKPKVAGFKPKRGEVEKYVAYLKSKEWTINPDEFEDVPAEVIEEFKNNYGGNWGIKKMRL